MLQLQPRAVIVVVITSTGGVTKRVLELEQHVDPGLVDWARTYLEEQVVGLRLGCLTHIDAQRTMLEARREASRLAELPLPSLDELSAHGIEAEIAVMQHVNSSTRVFAN